MKNEKQTDASAQDKKPRFKSLVIHGAKYKTYFTRKYENRVKYERPNIKELHSFIPGTVVSINVKEGQEVKTGDLAFVFEAMKMENKVEIPIDGIIKKIHVKSGQRVPKNHLLIEME